MWGRLARDHSRGSGKFMLWWDKAGGRAMPNGDLSTSGVGCNARVTSVIMPVRRWPYLDNISKIYIFCGPWKRAQSPTASGPTIHCSVDISTECSHKRNWPLCFIQLANTRAFIPADKFPGEALAGGVRRRSTLPTIVGKLLGLYSACGAYDVT